MHQTLIERWNRISLRTKITGVTVLMLVLGILVTGVGTAGMLNSYVEQTVATRLKSIAGEDLSRYFTAGAQIDGRRLSLGELRPDPDIDVFIAVYDPDGHFAAHNWTSRPLKSRPAYPETLTAAEVFADDFTVEVLNDGAGEPTFRAITSFVSTDDPYEQVPVLIAISAKPTQSLLTVYLTIFLGFGIGVVIIGGLLTRMLVTTTFAPLREVERTAAEIAEGDFSQRLAGATPNTEVGRLNRSLNTMLNRIDRAFRDRARTIEQMRRFVGDASHELRTPLVSVRGYAELYRMGALQTPEDVAQAMDRIEKEAIRMGLLVEDLLTLARLDETKPLELAPVDLVPLARDAALDAMAANPGRRVTVVLPDSSEDVPNAASEAIVQAVEAASPITKQGSRTITGSISQAGARLARLRRRPKLDAPGGATTLEATLVPRAAPPPRAIRHDAVVLAEENKIRQVITNLVGNAMRFTSADGSIEIRVSVDEPTERAVVEVIDHGEGIPPQIREKIFQRFWRADTSRARETGGSGLGLAIVSSIVAAHNGAVDVVETPGGGATFRVMLPLMGSAAAPKPLTTD